MKTVAFLFSVVVLLALAKAASVTTENDCKCWEDFKPEEGATGEYYCRGDKNNRIFGCGEEKPPICKCVANGETIELDLGETNCLSKDLQNGRWCSNKSEWDEYFKKHPERATYD